VIGYAREGDVIVVHTLNLIHDLAERGIGIRNLADPINVDSSNPNDPMAQLAVVLLALFGQMERSYAIERAAHARDVAAAKGRRIGRPVVVDPPSSTTPLTSATAGRRSPRSSPRPASRAQASTGTSRREPQLTGGRRTREARRCEWA
jgi:DNA invertase Pin-like site-specific DNA recombinase